MNPKDDVVEQVQELMRMAMGDAAAGRDLAVFARMVVNVVAAGLGQSQASEVKARAGAIGGRQKQANRVANRVAEASKPASRNLANPLLLPSTTIENHSQRNESQATAVLPVLPDSVSSPSGSDLSKPIEMIPASMERDAGGNAFAKALGQFCQIWEGKRGSVYRPTPADKNQLGRLLQTLAPADLLTLPPAFRCYLSDLSPFVAQEQGHSLAWFCTSGGLNKYSSTVPVVSVKEARTAAAGEQWLRLQGEGNNGRR